MTLAISISSNPLQATEEYNAEKSLITKEESVVSVNQVQHYMETWIKQGPISKLNVPVYEQVDKLSSGPATMQMVLEFLTGSKFSQKSLGTDMGLTEKGTTMNAMYKKINELSERSYEIGFVSEGVLSNDIISSIDQGCPLTYEVNTKGLNGWNNVEAVHHVVGFGYEVFDKKVSKVWYIDPYNYTDGLVNNTYGKQKMSFNEFLESMKEVDSEDGNYLRVK